MWTLGTILVPVLVGVLIKIAEKPLEGGADAGATGTTPLISNPTRATVEPSSTSPSAGPSTKAAPPILVDLVRLQSPQEASSWASREVVRLTRSQLAELNSRPPTSRGEAEWLRLHGAVDADAVQIKMIVQGNAEEGVDIIGMRADKKCSDPARGTLFMNPTAGADDNVLIGFDLDSADAPARILRGNYGLGQDYFKGKTIRLKKDERITFEMAALTADHYCEFSIVLETLSNGIAAEHAVDNQGSPFRVTALRSRKENVGGAVIDTYATADYSALYLVLQPDFVMFEPASPVMAAAGAGLVITSAG